MRGATLIKSDDGVVIMFVVQGCCICGAAGVWREWRGCSGRLEKGMTKAETAGKREVCVAWLQSPGRDEARQVKESAGPT